MFLNYLVVNFLLFGLSLVNKHLILWQCLCHSAAAADDAAASLLSCPTLCDPTDGSPAGSSVPGILQTRTLEWFAISFSRVSLSRQRHFYIYCLRRYM